MIAVAMAGMFLGQEAAQGKISAELGRIFGSTTSKAVEQMIEAAAKPKSGTMATVIGVVMLFVGASGVFGPKPAYASKPSRGGLIMVAASGLAGMVLGAIVTVVSAVVLVLKSVGKMIRST